MKKIIFLLVLLISSISIFSQRVYTNYGPIDVQKYEFHLEVNDNSNTIKGHAILTVLFNSPAQNFTLDLENIDATNKGMIVDKIAVDGNSIPFNHKENKLTIDYNVASKGVKKRISIQYHGIPKDGLVISKNKFGDRTFFGDNWPNRARQWLPTVDHPSDKALVEWHVIAPARYQVIGNGTQKEETDLIDNKTLYIWKTTVPIPTKVMVVGIARFAVENVGETYHTPISSWVYPQNKKEGFYDYAIAKEVINFFIEEIGPYPFNKLANVQSKTRFGGMENAGNIFYFENSVSGERKIENLFAHEIAHQWFGNSASESDWTHVWLSEGFATYFTNLYVLKNKGNKEFLDLVNQQRKQVISFHKKQNTPVLDTETTNLMSLLNANSYQKGGWFLHMLRHKVGDDVFWKSIRKYYKTYALKNASTNDLKNVFEEVFGQELDSFFTQWLEKSGHPILKTKTKFKKDNFVLSVQQVQKESPIFFFPLDLKIRYTDGSEEFVTIHVSEKKASFDIKTKSKVKEVILDPNSWLLFEKSE